MHLASVGAVELGHSLPFDKDYVTYVWFDALVNYISVPANLGDAGVLAVSQSAIGHRPSTIELWPADIHVIGKDILKFHAVYWPIMLKAMGLPLPKQILVHGWWQKDGAKMSKSTATWLTRLPSSMNGAWMHSAFTSCANSPSARTAIGRTRASSRVTKRNSPTASAIW